MKSGQSAEGCKFGCKCASVQEKWRQKCSCSIERDKEFGLCISGRGAAKIVIGFTEELNHDESNPMCQMFCSSAAQCQTSRPQNRRSIKFAMGILISVAPTLQNLRVSLGKRQSGKSTGLAKQRGNWQRKENPEIEGETQSYILLTYGKLVPPFVIHNETRGQRVCGKLWASMHMISRKDLNSAELETVRISSYPSSVITANGEVQSHEEATIYVKELGMFLTMKILEDTPAVSSLGKLCEDQGYSYEWINGQKPHLIKNGIRIQCNAENYVPSVVRVYRRFLPRQAHLVQHLQQYYRKTAHVQHLFQYRLTMREQMSKNGETQFWTQPKIQNPMKMRITEDHEPEQVTPCSSEIPEWLMSTNWGIWIKTQPTI